MKAFGVRIGTRHYLQSPPAILGNTVWAEVKTSERQPSYIRLEIQADGKNNISPLIIFQGKPYESQSSINSIGFGLNVPIEWMDGRPRTRFPGRDNLDVIFIDDNLYIKDVQIGLVTRKGKFFVTAQVVFRGWIEEEQEMCFIPSQSEFAYPGMNYRDIWKNMGEILSVMGRIVTEVTVSLSGAPLEKRNPAKWTSALLPEKKSWMRGTVLFFNAVTGTGQILGENGERHFVHFSRVLTDQPVPLLEAGEGVYLRLKDGKIRSCLPA